MKKNLLPFFVAISVGLSIQLKAQTTLIQDATGSSTISNTSQSTRDANISSPASVGRISNVAVLACPVITCPGNYVAYADTSCGVNVSFGPPTATDPCMTVSDTFSYSGSIITWTVPAGVTSLHIDARGAQGGNNGSSTVAPGLGAIMTGDFTVTPGQQLRILVGQNNNAGNGGGGGTFVTDISNVPMIVAGGGGGGGAANDSPLKHGQTGTSGGNGSGGGGNGGTGGNGGSIGASFASGAGGGLLTDGQDGWTANSGGDAFVNGGAGANVGFGIGGFGGGGNGSGYVVGAGGGGYSGGGSGSNSVGGGGVGGGGGSYNAGTNQVNSSGTNSGNGLVIITYSNSSALTISQIAGLASGSFFPIGTTVQTFVASDGSNNDTCSFTVTVLDTIAPAFVCPSSIAVNADSGMCSAIVTFATPTATDNCAVTSLSQSAGLTSGSAFPVGTTAVSFTASDSSGNTTVCSFNVTVTDAEAPVMSCPGTMTVNADSGMCSAVVNYNAPAAIDNCNIDSVSLTSGPVSGSAFPLGTTTITYTATDSAGNSSICSFDIVVVDAEAPVMTCPANITMNNDSGLCSAVVTFNAPLATDNCSGASVAQTGGPSSGSAFPIGTTTITYTATDSAGNTSSCSFDITVNDTEAPIVNCGANITTCAGVETMFGASATDLCSGIDSLTYVLTGATTGSGNGNGQGSFNVGVTTITYTATDSSGNTSSCSFTVTATAAPTVTAGASATTVCVTDGVVTLTGTPAGGTWTGPGVTGNTFDPAAATNGNHQVTYSYTDSMGCVGTATITIVVNPCTGVEEQNALATMQVSPNPAGSSINILLSQQFAEIEITLVQVNGQVVLNEKHSNTNGIAMDLSAVASGIYFLTVKAGDEMRIVKIVRE